MVDNSSRRSSGAPASAAAAVIESIAVRIAAIGRRRNRSDEMARRATRNRTRNGAHAASRRAESPTNVGSRDYGRRCYGLLTCG